MAVIFTTPEKRKASLSKYNNKPERKKAMREYYLKNKEMWRDKGLQKRYGITLNEYNTMLKKQNNCCFICKEHKSKQKKHLNVDHNHKTGKVRALLCTTCNTSLGLIKENISVAKTMIKYIESDKA